MEYINVNNVSFAYDADPVLDHVSYKVNSGEFVTLTGENGAAKSTLIKLTLGILKPKTGTVQLAKKDAQGRKLRMAYVPQQISSFNAGFPSTVLEFVRSGRYPRQGWFRRLKAHDQEHVQKALEAVDMWDYRDKKIGELSGGQKQRVIIARTFASDPDLFILDEPTVGMDDATTAAFYELMAHAAHAHGKAVLMITHDPESVKAYVDRNIHLARDKAGQFCCFEVHLDHKEKGGLQDA
ncbi:metal ABC transporter ATP-binding protein [Lactococcus termiticola]|uniref:Mn/Zn ABC-type transport system ATP-binding protein n=1 Tax=Lactococcus termiticola TaxID=2169526 RepID=A0A2R5HEI8_9LACT|nr:metal ABC transporter ATP-binding protein [Lactococcus termiticola]GBG96494.1 Mn/Zn ABC-type transport system ATP-binding protein [Lactococcus termiticola]